jgi:pyrimidine-nucleoside phosphorylase
VIDDPGRMPQPAVRETFPAASAGVVTAMDAELVGRAAVALGAGRDRIDAGVDPSAGITILAPVGTRVSKGNVIAELACSDAARLPAARILLTEAVRVGVRAPEAFPLVIDRI